MTAKGVPFPHKTEEEMLRFLREHVYERDGCYEWAGSLHATRLPKVVWRGKGYMARRLLLTLAGRLRSSKQKVYAVCGNDLCMNEEHLRIGSQKEVLKNASKTGRLRTGEARAQSNIRTWAPRAKLGFDKRDEVFRMVEEGMTHRQIGEHFGVTRSAVWHAIDRWSKSNLLLATAVSRGNAE